MKYVFSLVALGAMAAAAPMAAAQTVYSPVQYQYGAYHEIYYGGRNPMFTGGNYFYMPQNLQMGEVNRRYSAAVVPYPSPFSVGGVGTPIMSPYNPANNLGRMPVNSYIFSDFFPYEEVGQFGYTIDDARNEAYMNVPRYQTRDTVSVNAAPEAEAAPAPAAAPVAQRHAMNRERAIPLLNWAKAERGKNDPLYRALLQEARKYDPAAVAAMEKSK